jgi:hypothetical protein
MGDSYNQYLHGPLNGHFDDFRNKLPIWESIWRRLYQVFPDVERRQSQWIGGMVKCMSIVGKRSVDIRVMCIICAERMVGGTKTVMGGILTATSVIKLSQ